MAFERLAPVRRVDPNSIETHPDFHRTRPMTTNLLTNSSRVFHFDLFEIDWRESVVSRKYRADPSIVPCARAEVIFVVDHVRV